MSLVLAARTCAVDGVLSQQSACIGCHDAVHPCLAQLTCHIFRQGCAGIVSKMVPLPVVHRGLDIDIQSLDEIAHGFVMLKIQIMPSVDVPSITLPRVERPAVGVASFQECGAVGVLSVFCLAVGGLHAALIAVALFAFLHIVAAQLVGGPQTLRLLQGRPLTLLTGCAVVVQVVGIGKEHQSRMVVKPHAEESAQKLSVMLALLIPMERESPTPFGIGYPSSCILLLQPHIHHQQLLRRFLFGLSLHVVRHPLITRHVLHHIGRHVLQQQFAVAVEEVLPVQQHRVDGFPVHIDDAALLQRHARQFLDELVEHRAFCQIEGIGIIDERVAIHVELQLRRLHHHLVQLNLVAFRHPLQIDGLDGTIAFPLVELLDVKRHIRRLIALGLNLDEVLARLHDGTGDVGALVSALVVVAPVNAIDEGAVGSIQFRPLQPLDDVVRQVVSHLGVHRQHHHALSDRIHLLHQRRAVIHLHRHRVTLLPHRRQTGKDKHCHQNLCFH